MARLSRAKPAGKRKDLPLCATPAATGQRKPAARRTTSAASPMRIRATQRSEIGVIVP